MDIIGGGASNGSNGGQGGHSPNVIEGSDQTFVQDVIEPSKTMPVIVDFWAEWCGPCRSLGPTLEKVVDESNGEVRMVKIDVDRNPGVFGQIARMTGSQSIPTVVAFRNGQPVDAFMGALPESKVREFIGRVKGNGADHAPQISDIIAAAEEAMDADQFPEAAAMLSAVLEEQPDNVEALALLAKVHLKTGDVETAREVANLIPEDQRNTPIAAAVFSTLELAAHVAEPDETLELSMRVKNSPADLDARYALAQALAGQGKHEQASEQLFAILEKNVAWNEGAAKEQLLKIFEAAGPKADVTKEGRRRLSTLLFR